MRPYAPIALVSLAACASSPAPQAATAAAAVESTAPTPAGTEVGNGAVPASAAPAPRPGAGTFGPGVWEPEFRPGEARRDRSYLFLEDGRFEHRIAGYEALPSVACTFHDPVAYGGTWRRDGDAVALRVTWEDHIRGGHRAESPTRGCTNEGGAFARTELPAPRDERLPLGVCAAGFLFPEAPCVTLGGAPWYRTSAEGAEVRAAWYTWCARLPEATRPALCRERR